jgi:hypothetical protein
MHETGTLRETGTRDGNFGCGRQGSRDHRQGNGKPTARTFDSCRQQDPTPREPQKFSATIPEEWDDSVPPAWRNPTNSADFAEKSPDIRVIIVDTCVVFSDDGAKELF